MVGDRRRADYRAEYLLANDLHVRLGLGDDGRLHEIAAILRALLATGDDLRAILHAGIDEAGDTLELFVGNERPHLRARIEAGPELDFLRLVGDAGDHLVEYLLVDVLSDAVANAQFKYRCLADEVANSHA